MNNNITPQLLPENAEAKKAMTLRIVMKSLVYALAIMGGVFVLLLVFLVGMLKSDSQSMVVIPDKAILNIDFDKPVTEMRSDDLWAEITGVYPTSFYDLSAALNQAAQDDKIKAVVANISNSNLGLAEIQSLRGLIQKIREQGKKTYIYSQGFGDFGGGTGEYYLASAFDEIWMMPCTEAGVTGISLEVPFLKPILDKIGVQPEFYTRYEFKNAFTSLTASKMDKNFQDELQKMGGSIYGVLVADMAKSRNLKPQELKKIINNAPLVAEDAKKVGLIDELGYKPEMIEKIKKETGAEMLALDDYISAYHSESKGKSQIAYLVLDGVINSGVSNSNPLNGELTVGAQTVLLQLEDIAKENSTKALVLRINSPGGSYTASKEIWHALQKLKEDKKMPIVVSMGDYAASGGYFIALAGDYVVAEPSTITGSIGVLGGKMVLADLWQKIGVNWGVVKFGENAAILSPNRKFSESEKKIFSRSLDNIYVDFTAKVAEARKIKLSEMDKIARGRVWTGKEALKLNLIDDIGGINAAVFKALNLAKIPADKSVKVQYFPKEKTLQQKLAAMLGGNQRISADKLLRVMGLGANEVNMLSRLQHETVLPPLMIKI